MDDRRRSIVVLMNIWTVWALSSPRHAKSVPAVCFIDHVSLAHKLLLFSHEQKRGGCDGLRVLRLRGAGGHDVEEDDPQKCVGHCICLSVCVKRAAHTHTSHVHACRQQSLDVYDKTDLSLFLFENRMLWYAAMIGDEHTYVTRTRIYNQILFVCKY